MTTEAGGFAELARRAGTRLGGAREDGPGASEVLELLVLWLDGDPYALPVERVREIVRLRPVTPVPRVPEAVLGVISLRGEIVQVIDLRRRLGLAPAADSDSPRRRIVVLHGDDGQMAGLLVDRVSEVLRTPADALRAPTTRDADAVTALVPYGDRFVSFFDAERLLDLGKRSDRSPTP